METRIKGNKEDLELAKTITSLGNGFQNIDDNKQALFYYEKA
jgi:hypothetical protein